MAANDLFIQTVQGGFAGFLNGVLKVVIRILDIIIQFIEHIRRAGRRAFGAIRFWLREVGRSKATLTLWWG